MTTTHWIEQDRLHNSSTYWSQQTQLTHAQNNLVPSPLCTCGTEDQTICPANQHLREQIWSDGKSLHHKLYGKKEEPERTVGFIMQAGLSV